MVKVLVGADCKILKNSDYRSKLEELGLEPKA
jgi:hypothetical protein